MSDAFDFAAWNEWVVTEFRATDGHVAGYESLPLLLLTATGAKTGEPRLVPVGYMADGSRYVVFGVNGGRPFDPVWCTNLLADPEALVEVAGVKVPVRARVAEGEEHEDLWRKCLVALPSYEQYVSERRIPVFVLEPDAN